MRDLWRTILDAYQVWTIAAWVLLGAGLLLLLWALFCDRPGWLGRPRERCPGCGYDMSGTAGEAGVTCPECGRVAKNRRVFRKTRRRWGFVAVAVVLLAGWHIASRVQQIRVNGWWDAVPTLVVYVLSDPADLYRAGDDADWKSLIGTAERRFETCGPVMHWIWWPSIRREFETRGYVLHDLSGLFEYRTQTLTYPRVNVSSELPSGFKMHERAYETEDAMLATYQLYISLIEPEDWIDNGGDESSYWIIRSYAVVRASDRVNRAIEQFLVSLEQADCWPDAPGDAIRVGERSVLAYCTDRFLETDWFERLLRAEQRENPEFAAENAMELATDLIHENLAVVFTDDFDDALYGRWILHAGDWRRPRLLVVCLEHERERVIEAMNNILENGPSHSD